MIGKTSHMETTQADLAGARCSHCGVMNSLKKMASRIMQLVYSCSNCHGKTNIKTAIGSQGEKQLTGNRSDHGPNRSQIDEQHKCCLPNK